jgi:hypothetical protein
MKSVPDLYDDWFALEKERLARVAATSSEDDVAVVRTLCDQQAAVVAEIIRRQQPVSPERAAALRAEPKPQLPADPRQPVQAAAESTPRKRPRAPLRAAIGLRVG